MAHLEPEASFNPAKDMQVMEDIAELLEGLGHHGVVTKSMVTKSGSATDTEAEQNKCCVFCESQKCF